MSNESKQELAVSNESQAMIQMIEKVAMSKDFDVAKLEKMLDMQERVMNKNAEMAFNAALAEMQSEMPKIAENGEIYHGNKLISTFAKFEDINEAIKPILQKHGFAIMFKTDTSNQAVKVICTLTHRQGHSESTDIILPVDVGGAKNAVQAVASSVSYGKRYTMSALLNISTGDDDDGNSAVNQVEKIGEEQINTIHAMITENELDMDKFLDWLSRAIKCNSIADINVNAYDNVISALNKTIKNKASA